MDNLIIALDFTGVQAQTGTGMGYLKTGFHTASITSFKVYGEGDSQRLYTYMLTDGTTHREAFDLQKAKAQLKGFLLSSGLGEGQLSGAVKVPFHKLAGKTVYFYYTEPTLGDDKKPIKGGWPRYNWLTKAQYEAATAALSGPSNAPAKAAADLDLDDEPAEAAPAPAPKASPKPTSKPAAEKPAPAPKAAESSDDFGFLSDDE